MTMQLRIPGLADLCIVDRASLIFELDDKPRVGREPHGATNLVGRWLTGRLHKELRVGEQLLPTFVDRDTPGRTTTLEALEKRLSSVDLRAPFFRAELAQLALYVGGRESLEVGVLAQQLVGKCFDPGFRASKESYQDARLIANWVSKPSPRSLWQSLSGELERTRSRMWRRCRQDRMMLHGTVLALPNLVDALERMRALFQKRSGAQFDEVLRTCLEGPPRLMRVVRAPIETSGGELQGRPGALLIYNLKRARQYEPTLDVFMRGRWNQCPAHGLIPMLLAEVWRRAQHDSRRPRTLQFVQTTRGLAPNQRLEITEIARSELTPGNLETLKQWELDQLYAQLEAGPMPNGPYQGRFFFPEGIGVRSFLEAVPLLGARLAGARLRTVERLGGMLWRGKVFFPGSGDQGVLRNIIEHADRVAPLFGVPPSALRRTEVDGRSVALMFPARLFRGQSLADPTRESIIIDYDDGARIEGYVPRIDFLATRDGLRIRDEIRQVRPGLYLGRAYTDQRLLLMFSLYSAQAETVAESATESGQLRKTNGGAQLGTHLSSALE